VFTDQPLTGNQLAVFTSAAGLDDDTMQALAREMAFSETVFFWPAAEKGVHARLRIFTPAREIPFAGHPVLGSAFVIGATVQLEVIQVETGNAVVPVRLEREGARVVFGWMNQPVPTVTPFAETGPLLQALGVTGSLLPVELYDNGLTHAQVIVDEPDRLAALDPDLAKLAAVPVDTVSVVAGTGREVQSRVFAPRVGVPEDPATGSAAGPLALHLARHGRIGFGEELKIRQGTAIHRPSRLHARVTGSADAVERVEVGGAAVTVARGELKF